MLTLMILALALTAQNASSSHVRSTEPKILALIDAGISGSATFRRLIVALDESDVIVYVEPIRTRQPLRGYLAHKVVARGEYRYLRIALRWLVRNVASSLCSPTNSSTPSKSRTRPKCAIRRVWSAFSSGSLSGSAADSAPASKREPP